MPHLPQLDQQLRGIGRNHQHVGMRLDQNPRLLLVDLAQFFPRSNRLIDACIQVRCLPDPHAICADAAIVRQPVCLLWIEAIDRLREHDRQRVLACAAWSGKDQRVRQTVRSDRFPQVPNRRFIAEKVAEAHAPD